MCNIITYLYQKMNFPHLLNHFPYAPPPNKTHDDVAGLLGDIRWRTVP